MNNEAESVPVLVNIPAKICLTAATNAIPVIVENYRYEVLTIAGATSL